MLWNGGVLVNLHWRLREDHLTERLWLSLDPQTSLIKWNGGVVWMSGWFLCVPPLIKEGRYLVNFPRNTARDCTHSDQYYSSSMFHTIVLYVYICDSVGETGVSVGVFVLSKLLFQVHVCNGNNWWGLDTKKKETWKIVGWSPRLMLLEEFEINIDLSIRQASECTVQMPLRLDPILPTLACWSSIPV